jgi:formate--tetrahydrofolate ligase
LGKTTRDGPESPEKSVPQTRGNVLPPPGSPDIEIARAAKILPIADIARERLGVPAEEIVPYGHHKAKISLPYVDSLKERPLGKLVLVTAITPTPAGEGKTTTSVGLNDGLNAIGLKSTACLREPSLGPCFGMKGGAAGGGRAQVIPMDDINLHFNGDFHAITAAHSLLSAILDNHIYWDNKEGIDPRRVSWKRVVDMNDRALRNITIGLGGPPHGVPREDGFNITVASEIMAILCLASDLTDLQERLGKIIVARRRDKSPVTVDDIGTAGAMAVLLKDALAPNIVQSLEHNPVFIHGGPFANIAHGCNSVIATKTALALSDVVITEAGFGADLGAEKFLNIKCRQSGLWPDAVVLVATIRALKMHGGIAKRELSKPNPDAVTKGGVNLERHIENLQGFGITPIVAINQFVKDTQEEIEAVKSICNKLEVEVSVASHWSKGSDGAIDLAHAVAKRLEKPSSKPTFSYQDDTRLADKIQAVAERIYRAADVEIVPSALNQLKDFEAMGYGHLPVCIAKTQYSFSADPSATGAPIGHSLFVREVRLSAGAGFVVAVCGEIMTMPGLPRHPAALDIGFDENGEIVGLT